MKVSKGLQQLGAQCQKIPACRTDFVRTLDVISKSLFTSKTAGFFFFSGIVAIAKRIKKGMKNFTFIVSVLLFFPPFKNSKLQ